MKRVFILEDDAFLAQSMKETVYEMGYDCETFSNVAGIESRLSSAGPNVFLADLAVPLGNCKLLDDKASRCGFSAGLAFLRCAKRRWKHTRMALFTGKPSIDVQQWCAHNAVTYVLKPVARTFLERFLRVRPLTAFVVHGRNMKAVGKTKQLLRALRIKPVVLMEQPNKGRTVIEKFEEVSSKCDCAVVVVSPDDVGRLAKETVRSEQFRMRQNVVFELGYFYGVLRRRSGAVVLFEFGDVEIPSDIAGVIRVNGLESISLLKGRLKSELADL